MKCSGYGPLNRANALVQQEVRRSSPARADYLYSREMTHRINAFAEGVWALGAVFCTSTP
ncbi:hypothetical protein NON20_12050 [Synechocystis sp. B12]|nr:hypothetical protein NON20_12050 [Synechocystis sp. B12]